MSLYNTFDTTLPTTPRVTSTPFPNKKRDTLLNRPHLTYRRYSLSDVDTSFNKNVKQINTPPTRLHKSPLLTSSQQNLEAQRGSGSSKNSPFTPNEKKTTMLTHQTKYNSPGVFPIVHLFKRDLPILKEKPKNESSRLISPELSKHNTPEHNRMLLEKIIQSGNSRVNTNQNIEISTRSVLDALKEISRKRIHANEDCDYTTDPSKRLRIEHNNEIENRKRQRGDSPIREQINSSLKQGMRNNSYFNELIASTTSMEFVSQKSSAPQAKRSKTQNKQTEELPTPTPPPPPSQTIVKPSIILKNAETQTVATKMDTSFNENGMDQNKSVTETPVIQKRPSPVKIFDEAPLEQMRRNRLSVLLNASMDSPLKSSNSQNLENKKEKTITSILSNNEHKEKSNKHVTFDLPSNTSSVSSTPSVIATTSDNSNQISSTPALSTPTFNFDNSPKSVPNPITQTTTSITSPLSSTVAHDTPKSEINISSPSSFINNNANQQNVSTPQIQVSSISSTPKTSLPTPVFGIQAQQQNAENTAQQTTSPPKLGGFKFNLNPASSSVATTNNQAQPPTFSSSAANPTMFNTQTKSVPLTSTPSFNTSSTATTNAFSPFGKATSEANKPFSITSESNNTFSSSTNKPFTSTPEPNKLFSTNMTPQTTSSASTSFMTPPSSQPALSQNKFNFASLPSYTSAMAASSSNNAPKFSFTNSSSTAPTAATTTSATFNFSVPSTTNTSSTNFATTGSSMFTNNNNNNNNANTPFGTNQSPFGSTVSTSSFAPSTATSPFQTQFKLPTTTAVSSSGFGITPTTTSQTPIFGSSAQATTNQTPIFGNNSQVNSTTTSHTPLFGNTAPLNSTTTNQTPIFGSTAPINPTTTSQTPIFGNNLQMNPTTTSQTSIFGSSAPINQTNTNQTPIFGSTTPQVVKFGSMPDTNKFGNTTEPPKFGMGSEPPKFGSTSNEVPKFGMTAEPPKFGATPSEPPKFGSTAEPPKFSFGSTSNVPKFGSTPDVPKFGSTATEMPKFGSTSTDVVKFGSTEVPKFGMTAEVPKFGNTVTEPPKFGSTAEPPKFGAVAAEAPKFGNTFNSPTPSTSNNMFGSQTGFGAPNFGTSNFSFKSNMSFGKPDAPDANLNQSQPVQFGSSSTAGNSGFNFSANTDSANKPPVFSFGSSSTEPPKPTFNFSGGAASTSFNAAAPTPAFNFGSPNPTPSFGVNNNAATPFQFNATGMQPAATPGMFSIGSGSSTPRSRALAKGKRRT